MEGCMSYVFMRGFFSARPLLSIGASHQFAHTLYQVRHQVPLAHIFIYGGGNIVLQGLNWFWCVDILLFLVVVLMPGIRFGR